MRVAYDFSPLYRSMIGVDRMADLIESAMKSDGERNYPPADVEKTGEDAYRISLAVAGFKAEELNVVGQANLLTVTGRRSKDDEERSFLYRGIAARSFERRFELADHVIVKSAQYADGVLSIDLARELPEALKPRRVEIADRHAGGTPRTVERLDRSLQAA